MHRHLIWASAATAVFVACGKSLDLPNEVSDAGTRDGGADSALEDGGGSVAAEASVDAFVPDPLCDKVFTGTADHPCAATGCEGGYVCCLSLSGGALKATCEQDCEKASVSCLSPSHCGATGAVCCGQPTIDAGTKCVTANACPGSPDRRLCHSKEDCLPDEKCIGNDGQRFIDQYYGTCRKCP